MKFLILGSEGVIGKVLCKYLESIGHEILKIDLKLGNDHDLTCIDNNERLEKFIKLSDLVFFLAFDVGGSKYLNNDNYDILNNNILMISNVFNLIKKYEKKSIYATSVMSNMTYNNYGLAKLIGERYSELVKGISVKIWNVYGVEETGIKAHAITDFIVKSLDTGVIDMLTDGEEIRQYTYTEDFVKCLYIIVNNYEEILKEKKIVDISCFEWTKLIEVANLIKDIIYEKTSKEVVVIPSDKKATLQKIVNEPDKFILKYWNFSITLREGLDNIIDTFL